MRDSSRRDLTSTKNRVIRQNNTPRTSSTTVRPAERFMVTSQMAIKVRADTETTTRRMARAVGAKINTKDEQDGFSKTEATFSFYCSFKMHY